MVIVGGLGTVVGPAAGAAIWVVLRHYLSGVTAYWMLPMGLFFVAVVLFAGNGLYALIARTFEPRRIVPPAAGDA